MARRRRRYSGFGALNLSQNVEVMDVIAGLAVGIVGSAAIKAALNKFAPTLMVSLGKIGKLSPLLFSGGAAAAAYYAQKGSNRAIGHAVGALAAGATLSAIDYLRETKPMGLDFGAPAVSLNLGDYSGLLVNNSVQRPMSGLIVDNNANLGQLGAASMGGDDEMGYADIVALRS